MQIRETIAEIQFNRPAVLNAIDLDTALTLNAVLKQIRSIPDVRTVVLKGSGRGFMAGGDLSYFERANRYAPTASRRLLEPMHEAIRNLADLPCPVIASVHGPVAGAGMSLAMIADLCVAAQSARFNLAYLGIGNSVDCGASWSLPRLVGLRKAMEIALLCETLTASDAQRTGIVNFVVSDDQLAAETESLARRIAALPPTAATSVKRQFNSSFQHSLKEQLDHELSAFVRNAKTADFMEGVRAFLQKRAPHFTGQ